MTPEQQFENDAQHLANSDRLAAYARLVSGDDAGSALIGAALKVWEAELGSDNALRMAERALQIITASRESGTVVQ